MFSVDITNWRHRPSMLLGNPTPPWTEADEVPSGLGFELPYGFELEMEEQMEEQMTRTLNDLRLVVHGRPRGRSRFPRSPRSPTRTPRSASL